MNMLYYIRNNYMKILKKIVMLAFFVSLVAFGAGLTLKAAIGVEAWDALSKSGADIFRMKIGDFGMITNSCCVFVQIAVLKREFKWIQLLQFLIGFLLGIIINFVLYDILGSIALDAYFVQVILLVAGLIIVSFGVSAVMVLDLVTFPLEGACMAVSNKIGKDFSFVRQMVDVISVILCLILAFTFNVPLAVREGTIIGVIVFGPLMGFFMKMLKPIFKKFDLIDYN